MKKREARSAWSAALVVAVVGTWGLRVEAQSPAGAEELYRFFGPQSLAGGSSVVKGFAAASEHFNPAIAADNQRTTLDIHYTALANLAGDPWGHGAGLGASFPTRFAVWNLGLWLLTSANPDYGPGTLGGLRFGIAKDVYDDLYVGLGVQAGAGGLVDGQFDYSVTGSLGFVHRPYLGEIWRNFRWGMVLREMGKAFQPSGATSNLPFPFTPAVGVATDLLPPGVLQVSLGADLAFPSFQNLVASTHAQLFFRISSEWGLGLRSSWTLDVRDVLEAPSRRSSLLPAVGIYVTGVTEIDTDNPNLSFLDPSYRKSDLRPALSWAAVRQDTHAVSIGANLALGMLDTRPPEITVEASQPIFFSPNADGVQDEVSLPWSIRDERFLASWTVEIKNQEGQVVRTLRNKELRPELQGLESFFDRLLAVKEGVPVPETLRWDGRMDDGTIAPEGTYTLHIRATDDNGNTRSLDPLTVVLDLTPPQIRISALAEADKIFSPDGDGLRDVLVIGLETSEEKEWNVQVLDAAEREVRTFTISSGRISRLEWDGRDDSGNVVPDGVYAIRIRSQDEAGNTAEELIRNLVVNTRPTPIGLNLSYAHFSPNGDGVRDTIVFEPLITETEGIARWVLSIEQQGRVIYQRSGQGAPPSSLSWDGNTDQGPAPEGYYTARLTLNYLKGNNPSVETGSFRLDRTAPSVSLLIDGPPTFSPGGEGKRSTLPLFKRQAVVDEEDEWTGQVVSGNPSQPQQVVRTFTWRGRLPEQFAWDGTDSRGRVVPDGNYFYRLEGVDPAGNRTLVLSPVFTVDTRERTLLLSAETMAFSPNNDGIQDRLTLLPRLNIQEGVGSWTLRIANAQGATVRTFSGSRSLPESIFWDGNLEGGGRAPEGRYSAALEVQLLTGQTLTAVISPLVLDVTPPQLTLQPQQTLFNPSPDSVRTEALIRASSSLEERWVVEIRQGQRTVRRWEYGGRLPEVIRWNGRDEQGNLLQDGTYALVVSSQDAAGNAVSQTVPNIQLDSRPAQVFITAASPLAAVAADGTWEVRFTLTTLPAEGIESWKVEFFEVGGRVPVSVQEGRGRPPTNLTWRAEPGRNVPDGRYFARFSALWARGNAPTIDSSAVVVDTTPPKLTLSVSPELFSPDDDGFNDELRISIDVQDLAGIRDWQLQVLDPTGRPFHEWKGQGLPASTLVWDGRGFGGELVQAASDYELVLTARDLVGLQATTRRKFTTDILVIREGNRFRIAVPSIVFQANSARLLADGSDEAQRNVRILRRLAEVLNRFNTYRITVEGHAASLQYGTPGYEREENEILIPLSLSRAETVRDELARLGVDRSRMRVEGVGGRRPAVPHTDAPNRWKNRRVVFYLDR